MTTASGRWAAATASVRGASHERDGRPNQDAVRVVQVRGKIPGLVAAVCDGHGGDRYVRSDVGSRLGVEVACEVGQRALADLGPTPNPSTVEARLVGVVAESIIERWRERVLDDVQRRAFTDDERARAGVPLDGDPHISYGATLLLAILAPSWVGLLQIGDGDVTVVREAHAESPVPTDDRLVGGETTSLCLPGAAADARSCVLVEPLPETIILTSDGYANSFASPTWRTDAGIDLREHVRRNGLDVVEIRLPSWLADSATAGGDDVSMALIQRVDRVASPLPVTAATPKTRTGTSGRRSQRRGSLAMALTVVALVGIAAGWILARAGASEADSATTVASVATSPSSLPLVQSPVPSTASSIAPKTSTPKVVTPTSAGGAAPVTRALTADDTPQLLVGGSHGLLLAFDPTQATPTKPLFLAWVDVVDRDAGLPRSWRFDAGRLTFNETCVTLAAVVLKTENYVWAVSPDGKSLTSYDPADPTKAGQDVAIQNGRALDPVTTTTTATATTGGEQRCPNTTVNSVGGRDVPVVTSQGS